MPLKLKFKFTVSLFFGAFLLLSPICDLITGIFLTKLGMSESFLGSPSQLLRLLFLFFGFYFSSKSQKNTTIKLFFWLLILEIFSIFYTENIKFVLVGLNYSMKIVYIYLLYCIMKRISNIDNGMEYIMNLFFNSAFLYSLGILIPTILGIGTSTYEGETFGQKGLYASGNALGIYLGTSCSLIIIRKNKVFKEYIKTACLLISLLLLGTKTALLFIFVTCSLLFFKQKRTYIYLLLSCLVFIIFYYWNEIVRIFSLIFDVIIFRFQRSENLFKFLLSGRDDYVSDAFYNFSTSPFWLIKSIFGGGAFMSFRTEFTPYMTLDILEMDLFDIFFMYGFIGVLIYLFLCFYYLKKCSRNKILFLLLFLFIFHSIIAGHIIFDGLPVVAGIIIILLNNKDYQIKNKYLI